MKGLRALFCWLEPILIMIKLTLVALASIFIAGCGDTTLEDITNPGAKQKIADAKAIGAACRLAGHGIEPCFKENSRASKASILDGWREMDGYMRENKMAEIPTPGDKE